MKLYIRTKRLDLDPQHARQELERAEMLRKRPKSQGLKVWEYEKYRVRKLIK